MNDDLLPVSLEWQARIEQAQRQVRYKVGGRLFPRIAYGTDYPNGRAQCRDCRVQKGQLHVLGCCVERCPRCIEGQLFGCSCFEERRH